MPRLARFRIAAIDELFRQLRFAPRETRLRQMNAAEALVADIDPRQTYPTDFIIFRITGYRPESVDDAPLTLVGEALLGDLVILIQRLSEGLDLPADHDGRQARTIEEVARRLRISIKTLQRYRRRGLVCHYVQFADLPAPGRRLACFEDALQRFMRHHHARLDRAASFTRVEPSVQRRIIEEARELREVERVSLNEAALRLASRYGRAHETIRGLLRRHDRRAGEAIFTEHGPLTERDGRLIHRADRWGIPTADLAAHFGKTPATIRRVLNRHRGDLLQALDLRWIDLPTFALVDAEAVILSAPAVVGGLEALLPATDALALIDAAQAAWSRTADEEAEDALAAGYNLLKRRAQAAIEALPAWPAAGALDAIETDLRWATRLKRRLVSLGLPAAIARIEQYLHRPLGTQPADRIVQLLTMAAEVISRVAETLNPPAGQRLARRGAYAMDRALAAPGASEGGPHAGSFAGRAAARHGPGTIRLDDIHRGVTAWEEMLDLSRRLGPLIDALADPPIEEMIRLHYGLTSGPPLTCAAIAGRLGLSPASVARLLRRGEQRLRTLARRRG
jgi:RNA polymerase primary sigma factor